MSADFKRFYGTDLRDAVATWPVTDLVALVRKLPSDSQLVREEVREQLGDRADQADWGYLPENVARLVDLVSAWLHYEYAAWTADLDEVKAARKGRRKPPPFPMVPPVARRPPSLHERLAVEHEARVAEFDVDPSEPRMVTDEEFDTLLDKWT